MGIEQTWQVIEQQRLAVADLLDRLTAEQWEAPSLCAGWRIRDVAAHLTTVSLPPSAGLLHRPLTTHRTPTVAGPTLSRRHHR